MTAEELSALIKDEIGEDARLHAILDRIRDGKANLTDSELYAAITARITAQQMRRNVLSLDKREAAFVGITRERYTDTFTVFSAVQRILDAENGIHIKPQKPPFEEGRAHKIGHSLEDRTVPDSTIERRARSATENFCMSHHDDCMRVNAEFRARAGLQSYAIREGGAKCCDWCADVSGKYPANETPAGFWGRHDNCKCSILYESKRSGRQLLRGAEDNTRRWEVVPENAGAEPLVRLTHEQARELIANAQLRALVYDMKNPVKAFRGKDITLHRVTTAHNALYVSDGARKMAKPKIIHQIDMRVSEVMKLMGIQNAENHPAVYVIDGVEMAKATVAAYNAVENVLFVNIGTAVYSKENMPDIMKAFACGEDDRSSYIHELYHWLDAEKYRKKYGIITKEKNDDYKAFAIREGKKQLDKLASNGYNIYEISPYAVMMSDAGAFDEIYTEFRTKALLVR